MSKDGFQVVIGMSNQLVNKDLCVVSNLFFRGVYVYAFSMIDRVYDGRIVALCEGIIVEDGINCLTFFGRHIIRVISNKSRCLLVEKPSISF